MTVNPPTITTTAGTNYWTKDATTNIYMNQTGNVGIGTSTTPINLLELTKSSYTGAFLSIDAGIANDATGAMARAIGKPLIKLGRTFYSTTAGDYYGIGFGFAPLALSHSCCEIGVIITSIRGNETGDIVLSTRAGGTNIPATERMRIVSGGNVGIGIAPDATYKLNVSGDVNISSGSKFRIGGTELSTFTSSSTNLISVFNTTQFENVSSLISIKTDWKPTTTTTTDTANGLSGTPSISVSSITASGLITGNLGLTIPASQTLTSSGTLTANIINASGLITGNLGLTIPASQTLTSSGTLTANVINASGLITANTGLTISGAGQALISEGTITANIINASGLITANGGITAPIGTTTTIRGTLLTNSIVASELITANGGLTIASGQTLTSGVINTSGLITATQTTAGTNDMLNMRYNSTNGIRFSQRYIGVDNVAYDLIQKVANVDKTTTLTFYNGNIGIGRTDPTNIFQIGSGNKLRIANNNTDFTIIGTGEAPELHTRIVLFGVNSTDPGFGGTGNILYLSGNGGTHIFFTQTLSGQTERMRIGNNGNVAIGTTDTATYKLNVNGTINATSILVGGSSVGSKWTTATDTTKIYYNGGNVGIGTTNPQAKLDVVGNDPKIRLLDARADGNASIEFKEFDDNYGFDIQYSGGSTNLLNIRSYEGSTTPKNIMSFNRGTQSVGIGTTSSTGMLEIIRSVYNGALLSLDAGTAGCVSADMPREVGKPMLKLGRNAYSANSFGDYYGIGFGFSPLITDKSCCEIGCQINDNSGYEQGNILFSTRQTGQNVAPTQRMKIWFDGDIQINKRLGIGFDTYPAYTLDVPINGTGSTGTLGLRYFNYNTNIVASTTYIDNVCARFSGSIWCGSWIASSSDSRIKEDIEDINDDTALNMILAIEPKTYKYIDKVEKGHNKVYGFIAQQIRQVTPDAVSIENGYIPNIMLLADYDNKIITLPSQPTKVIIKINDKIKCFGKDNYYELEVIEIIDDLTFKIKKYEGGKLTDTKEDIVGMEGKQNTIINDFEYTDNKIFVCGTEVDDFHTISKEYIFTLNVCATQELHRRIISQEERIKQLETKMTQILNNI
jgi:hypothetical protein